jgi:hypothetical protein
MIRSLRTAAVVGLFGFAAIAGCQSAQPDAQPSPTPSADTTHSPTTHLVHDRNRSIGASSGGSWGNTSALSDSASAVARELTVISVRRGERLSLEWNRPDTPDRVRTTVYRYPDDRSVAKESGAKFRANWPPGDYALIVDSGWPQGNVEAVFRVRVT